MRRVGLPDETIAGIRQSPYWELGVRIAPTLAYDAAVLGDTRVPVERYTLIDVPTLVLAGSGEPGLPACCRGPGRHRRPRCTT